mgnify:CR=1 FL=1
MMHLLFAALLLVGQTPVAPISAKDVKVTPKPVAEFEMSKLRGVIRRLSWNADATLLYLQTAELRNDALPKELFHYTLDPKSGDLKKLDAEPAWSVDYSQWKLGQSAPGEPTLKIEVASETRRNAATSLPMAGEMARGGGVDPTGGASAESVMAAAQQSQSGTANLMRLKGQIVGEWLNQPIVPGQSFGWGPLGTAAIAYAEPNNRQLVIMDKSGERKKISDTKGVYAPAFTADATKLAWIEVRGKKATLVIGDVSK